MNDFHSVYTNGIYIPMVALLVVCESVKYLIGFAIFVPVLCSAILLTDSPQTDPLFFLLGAVASLRIFQSYLGLCFRAISH